MFRAPRPTLELPHPDDEQELVRMAREVRRGNLEAWDVAYYAVRAGFMLIGTTVSKPIHKPVRSSEHTYNRLVYTDYTSLPENNHLRIPEASKSQLLRAGFQVDIAVLAGLFGDLNSCRQRIERCAPYTGRTKKNFGWRIVRQATLAFPVPPGMNAQVQTHARPQLINAARMGKLKGCIDAVYPDPNSERIAHDAGQYLGTAQLATRFTLPLNGHDLQTNIVATNYDD